MNNQLESYKYQGVLLEDITFRFKNQNVTVPKDKEVVILIVTMDNQTDEKVG